MDERGAKSEPKDTAAVATTQSESLTDSDCHPSPNALKTQYIVGYGSLMNSVSKSRTYSNTGENIPVKIHGFSRCWNLKSIKMATYLGVIEAKSSDSFNAVVFKLPPGDANEVLMGFDKRERSYCRRKVPIKDVKFFDTKLCPNENEEYWIYINKPEFISVPDKEHPIVQSYVDVFVSGCIEIEEKFGLTGFAENCIDSTEGWSKYWVNDRKNPTSPTRLEPKFLEQIDKILAAKVPDAYNASVIEG